jgi:hypothetical protein
MPGRPARGRGLRARCRTGIISNSFVGAAAIREIEARLAV